MEDSKTYWYSSGIKQGKKELPKMCRIYVTVYLLRQALLRLELSALIVSFLYRSRFLFPDVVDEYFLNDILLYRRKSLFYVSPALITLVFLNSVN